MTTHRPCGVAHFDYREMFRNHFNVFIQHVLVTIICRMSQHISDVGTTQPVFIIAEKLTRCSAIVERPRCRVRYSFGQNWKTGK